MISLSSVLQYRTSARNAYGASKYCWRANSLQKLLLINIHSPLIITTFNTGSTMAKLPNRKETKALRLTSSTSSGRKLTDSLGSKLALFRKIMMQI